MTCYGVLDSAVAHNICVSTFYKPMADKKKTKLTTYVDEQLAEDIKEIADTQDRPVSYVIGKILEEQVRKTKEEEEKSDDK